MNSLGNMGVAKIGMLGSGSVGETVQELVFKGDLAGKLGTALEIVKIYTPHPRKKKLYRKYPELFTTHPEEVTDHPEVDIVLEVLGSQGERDLDGFRDLIIRALRNRKSIVTSDKAVLARYGKAIWSAARRYGREIRFEACVGAGIPIIRSLTESLSAEEPEAIYGIINGTCNYILSEMKTGGKSYERALREAQARGCAETNPEADTSGRDAEAKLILLAAVTFGAELKPPLIWRQGIERVDPIDFYYAQRKGSCTIKHLAVARKVRGSIESFVSPVLVPNRHFLATIDGVTNAIFFKGKRSQDSTGPSNREDRALAVDRDWNYVFVGPGAGGGPTAIALLGDVGELARNPNALRTSPYAPFSPGPLCLQPKDRITAHFYIRFVVKDRSGIVGDICQIFGDKGIGVSEVWQLSHGEEELRNLAAKYGLGDRKFKVLPFVVTLERTTIGQVKEALGIIKRKNFILVEPLCLPIWGNPSR